MFVCLCVDFMFVCWKKNKCISNLFKAKNNNQKMSSEKLTEQLQHNAESIAKQLDAIEAQIAALELHNQQSKQIQNHASTNVNQNQSTNHSQTQANNSPNTITKTPSASQNAPASGSLDSMHHLHPQVMERKSSNICVFGAGSFGTSEFCLLEL